MWDQATYAFWAIWNSAGEYNVRQLAAFFPFIVLLELPLYLLVMVGMVRFGLRSTRRADAAPAPRRYPSVSCVITCYSEGRDVCSTVESLVRQNYPGMIEVIPVVDGAIQNRHTLEAARSCPPMFAGRQDRRLIIVPKWQRGGRVSSLNAGLQFATGEVTMALDADTSFDTDMVMQATKHFADPGVVGVSGNLRVRNYRASLIARLQSLEYVLSIGAGKTGLSEFNIVNNISGAFGIFRTAFIRRLGGWDSGTAEDLDMTLRIKQYFGRHKNLRVVFDPHAMGHTDAPDTWRGFFKQRLRWDGDLFYLFVRKFRFSLRPRLLGWPNFLFVVINGLFVQVLLPFLILGYTVFLLAAFPFGTVLGVLALTYVIYLAALYWYFLVYLVAISERPRLDAGYLLLLPLFPLFAFVARLHSCVSLLQEALVHSHRDSAMAPPWVLKKTKF